MTTHICIPIDKALELLQQGKNPFDGTPLEAFQELMTAKSEGKTYYSGCDNMKANGMCGGHEDEVKEENV